MYLILRQGFLVRSRVSIYPGFYSWEDLSATLYYTQNALFPDVTFIPIDKIAPGDNPGAVSSSSIK